MCNVGQHISKTSKATPRLFYIDEIQVLQRILLQFFKQIVLLLYFRCEPPYWNSASNWKSCHMLLTSWWYKEPGHQGSWYWPSFCSNSLCPAWCNGLTHCPLEDMIIWSGISNFQTNIKGRYLGHFLWNCPQVKATRPFWWLINIGSGNGLMPSGNKPLPEPMLSLMSATIWRHWATMC